MPTTGTANFNLVQLRARDMNDTQFESFLAYVECSVARKLPAPDQNAMYGPGIPAAVLPENAEYTLRPK